MPTFIFTSPRFHIKPAGSVLADNPEMAFEICSNREDALNDWASNDDLNYGESVELAVLDACFRFGIMEYGYSADYLENTLLRRPAIKTDYQYNTSGTKIEQVGELELAAENERVYARWIPARQFYVSTNDGPYFNNCDWVGYYEFVRTADLVLDKNLINTDLLERQSVVGYYSEDLSPSESAEKKSTSGPTDGSFVVGGYATKGDLTLIWKIWDIRKKKHYIFADGCELPLLNGKDYKVLPFEDLRFKRRSKGGWYPIPLTWNWVHAQNEQNESKEGQRMHRRRFKRMYQIVKSRVDDVDEIQKALDGPDGTCFEVIAQDAIIPVPNADLGSSANNSLQSSKDDFLVMSGTTAEQLGESDRITATQATYTANRAAVRENAERSRVGKFLTKGAHKVILLMQSKLVKPFPVSNQTGMSRMVDPMTDLGDESVDFKAFLEVDSQSPIANDEETQKFLEFLSLLAQFPQFSLSPLLVRELAFRTGYKNESVIQEFMQMAQLAMLGQISMGQQNLQAQQQPPAPASSNGGSQLERTRTQLRGQGIPIK